MVSLITVIRYIVVTTEKHVFSNSFFQMPQLHFLLFMANGAIVLFLGGIGHYLCGRTDTVRRWSVWVKYVGVGEVMEVRVTYTGTLGE